VITPTSLYPYSGRRHRMNGIPAGPSANVRNVSRTYSPSAAVVMMRLFCFSVRLANGTEQTTRPLMENAYTRLMSPWQMWTTTHPTGHYCETSRDTSEGLRESNPAACNRRHFAAMVSREFLFRAMAAPCFLTPLRHAQGVTGDSSAHIPRCAACAARSNFAKWNACGTYRLYHHAKPAEIISSVTSRPSGRRSRTTQRPYLSQSISRAATPWHATMSDKNIFDARKPNCPCSGASMPHNRKMICSPDSFLQMMVSPSQKRSTINLEFNPCLL
jgi:hypothetical protein